MSHQLSLSLSLSLSFFVAAAIGNPDVVVSSTVLTYSIVRVALISEIDECKECIVALDAQEEGELIYGPSEGVSKVEVFVAQAQHGARLLLQQLVLLGGTLQLLTTLDKAAHKLLFDPFLLFEGAVPTPCSFLSACKSPPALNCCACGEHGKAG